MARRVIAVLGMHRSGTSCLAGLLEQAGVFLGNVSKKDPYNLRGNHEHSSIVNLHEAVLAANGASWDVPPASAIWSPALKALRDDIIKSYDGAPVWGFKDPRTLLVLEGWREALPALELVGIFRHPLSVATSLNRRNGWSLDQGLDLWRDYNERLLRYQRRYRFPIVSFDHEPFVPHFERLTRVLDLPAADARLDFFDPSLRHGVPAVGPPLPAPVQDLYRTLQRLERASACG